MVGKKDILHVPILLPGSKLEELMAPAVTPVVVGPETVTIRSAALGIVVIGLIKLA